MAFEVLSQDVEAQAAKFQRTSQAVEAARGRAIHAGVELAPETPQAVDIATRQVREQNQSILFALANALQDYTEDVLPLFENLCQERGVALPSRPFGDPKMQTEDMYRDG